MLASRSLLASLALAACAGATQTPLTADSASDSYKFKWPIHRVAIIGAGPSGLIAHRELTAAGFRAHIFERDHVPGGNWHYTDETAPPAPIPPAPVAVGDFVPSLPPPGARLPYEERYYDAAHGAELRRAHRGPKPLWASLHSNAPAPVQEFPELPWPAGTAWELPHYKLQKYLRAFASFHGLNSNDGHPDVAYNTRVERVAKRHDAAGRDAGWTLTLKRLVRDGNATRATWYTEDFDAVVVATGRFNAPHVPAIPGVAAWAARFPERIAHSRAYRRPEPYANETILIVGAATSGGEISRDLNPFARKIYQSIRPDNASVPHFQLSSFLRRLPANTTVVPEIARFHAPGRTIADGRIELANGTVITGIDRIIFATGFRYSFPFLPQYHNPALGPADRAPRGPQPLVTDGTHVRSLHLDLFYIEEPTLALLSMNLGMQTFTYAEYLALALAAVWGARAALPGPRALWAEYDAHVRARGGHGRHLQFLGTARTHENVRRFVGWLDAAAARHGGRQIGGLPAGYAEVSAVWARARFGGDIFTGAPEPPEPGAGVDAVAAARAREAAVLDALYSDDW